MSKFEDPLIPGKDISSDNIVGNNQAEELNGNIESKGIKAAMAVLALLTALIAVLAFIVFPATFAELLEIKHIKFYLTLFLIIFLVVSHLMANYFHSRKTKNRELENQ